MLFGGATIGYQLSLGHPNNLYVDLQGGTGGLAGAGVGWAWQHPVLKSVPSVVNCSGLLRLGWELNMIAGSG